MHTSIIQSCFCDFYLFLLGLVIENGEGNLMWQKWHEPFFQPNLAERMARPKFGQVIWLPVGIGENGRGAKKRFMAPHLAGALKMLNKPQIQLKKH